jgi:hypothetical protein
LIAIGVSQISSIALGGREFLVQNVLDDLSDLWPEIRLLQQQGFIEQSGSHESPWRIRPGVLLWWLSDELVRILRDDRNIDEWLRDNEWHGAITPADRNRLRSMLGKVNKALEKGVSTLIEAAAKGAGQALVSGG